MLRKVFLSIILALGAGASLTGCAPAPPPPGRGPASLLRWDWFAGPLSCLLPLLIGAVIIVIIALLLKQWPNATSVFSSSSRPSARDIVQERYARGEIDRQEYQRMLQDLAETEQVQSPVQNMERA